MADASCSGGTPFKQLVDHQSRDASHHQDRLVQAQGPRGSFRAAPQPQHQQAQAGFDAFMQGPTGLPGVLGVPDTPQQHAAGRLNAHTVALHPAQSSAYPPAHLPAQPLAPRAVPMGQPPQFHYGAAGPQPSPQHAWSAEFNQYSINSNYAQQNALPAQPAIQPHMQNQFHNHFSPLHAMPGMYGPPTAYGMGMTNNGYTPVFGPVPGGVQQSQYDAAKEDDDEFVKEMDKWMAVHGPRAEAKRAQEAAAAATAEAAASEDAAKAATTEKVSTEAPATKETVTEETKTRLDEPSQLTDLDVPELGNLSLNSQENVSVDPVQETQENIEESQSEAPGAKSDVAEAAERLLESVEHEDGDKWKNSNFLKLMRDFRDGNKEIIGNDVVDAATGADAGTEAEAAVEAAKTDN